MPREEYSDWISRNGGPSDEDYQTAVDTVGGAKDLYNSSVGRVQKGLKKGKNTKSIIGMASRNTFDFPVFISKSVPLDYATATNMLLEQLYAAYVQMAVSQNPYVDAKSVECGGLLAKFHTNVSKYVEYVALTDTEYQHDACHKEIYTEDAEFVFDMIDVSDEDAQGILQEMNYEPLSEFDDFFQEGGHISSNPPPNPSLNPNPGGTNNRNKKKKDEPWENARERQAFEDIQNVDARGNHVQYNPDGSIKGRPRDPGHEQYNRDIYRRRVKNKADMERSVTDAELSARELKNYNKHEREKTEEHRMKMMNRSPEVLKEEDMKKMNSMKPLLMKLQMRVTRPGQPDDPREFVIGVHCHARLIEPSTLPDVVKFPLKEMNEIARRAKWKAGELKFMRDIVFQIKERKQTAVDAKDPKRKWYRRLYELAHSKGDANVSGSVSGNSTTGLIPNATIMITNGDVENIKSQTKLDVLKPSLAKRLCKELFLMSFVVIDQDAESIKLYIPDLYKDWEIHSLSSVEKQLAELSTAGSKTRDLFKLIK